MSLQQHPSIACARIGIGLLALTMLAGCSQTDPIQVKSRYGPGVRPSGLGPAFAWAPAPPTDPAGSPLSNPEVRQLIHGTLERELAAKGFTLSTADAAGFWLDCRIGRREKTDASVNPHGDVIEEGSLVLDVLDPETGKLIWRGVAQARINREASPEMREKRLNLAVRELIKAFPPK